ncbi:MAG TPA: carboxypeptidase-like regulatory domain-containing protein [Chitinophagales bacterium]|nr:carboxypeptidase-like regulatory domain-containing protein [Chitinophagales bacterium]
MLFWGRVSAQNGSINGRIYNDAGARLQYATVYIDTLNAGALTDNEGRYVISNITPGDYRLTVSMLGYAKKQLDVTVRAGKSTVINVILGGADNSLKDVVVEAQRKKDAERLREQPFAVTSLDVTSLQNLNLDVNAVLNRTTGIRIRQEGGLGSDFSFSLNGFTGNQVRFFIDGLPADYLGPTLSFNTIPVNIIERIEVYKGVVPVTLGADALGGAVNLVTNNNAKSFIDASYSYGSFNTHQAAIAGRAAFNKGGIINASGFFNYSDNTYKIDAQLTDRATGKIGPVQQLKRFNDGYLSASVMVEGGVVNKRWADKLLIGFIGSGNRKEIQQGANMTKVAGEVFRTDRSYTPTIKYQKSNLFTENLTLKLAAVYTYNQSMTVDTSSHIYDWDGSYTTKSTNVISGELNWDKTMFRFTDHAALVNFTMEYVLRKNHTFTINNTYSWFRRVGQDPLSYNPIPFSNPNTLSKNITGISYKLSLFKNRWNTTVFAKLFHMNAKVYTEDPLSDGFLATANNALQHGEGIATNMFITRHLQTKLSYEYTSRLPENYELFGDGLLLVPNTTLTPEKSHNFNAGVLYGQRIKNDHLINAEAGFVFRKPEDMIRLVAIGVTSQYQNLASAGILGYEASFRYAYKQWISIELNATYQDIRNTNKQNNNYPDPLYKDRIPNIPYLFGNALVAFQTIPLSKYNFQVGLHWATMYVEQFYLKWPSQGQQDAKYVIPRQLSHDISATVSAFNGRYNISFTCVNVAGAKRYDNFKVQKPGRSFNVKLRVYFDQFKKVNKQ